MLTPSLRNLIAVIALCLIGGVAIHLARPTTNNGAPSVVQPAPPVAEPAGMIELPAVAEPEEVVAEEATSEPVAVVEPALDEPQPLPEPVAPKPAPLVPLAGAELAQVQRQVEEHLLRETGLRKLPRVSIPEGEPANPWHAVKEFAAAKKKKDRYLIMARHLGIAEQLFAQDDLRVRRSGLGIVTRIMSTAVLQQKDYVLAELVAEAYLLPNLDAANPSKIDYHSEFNLLQRAVMAFAHADRYDRVEQCAGRIIERADTRNVADAWRLHLAAALRKQGREEFADAVLADVHDPSLLAAKGR
ncbi:hypothetical protein [Stratiformator vulcanicus]|uniref:Uncharacterized protein n=1 Tax=Stratiformator vulcanicus TaxID=2527980 RepID=A0A517R0G4_9PLAN|nr:hypothetical protein [Stratiformator vulcanicus]QDT37358.1 hypothetical protein Pan189_17310 [Stratiformator vulcanicus]